MKLRPVRFVGHKIGPFDHIELKWEKDSCATLIVAENGMGKTTLIAAMAACLSLGETNLFPDETLRRFSHDEESYAYFELTLGNETGWVFRSPLSKEDQSTERVIRTLSGSNEGLYMMDDAGRVGDARRGAPARMVCSHSMLPLKTGWQIAKKITTLAAAYGVGRELQLTQNIKELRELSSDALKDILDPFAPIPSNDIFQWIANLDVYHSIAASRNELKQAQAYLESKSRVQNLLSKGLEFPVSFRVELNPFRLEVKQNGLSFPVNQLSDGTRSFLSWQLDYLMRASRVNWADPAESALAPGLILVDEIDVHLHPEWQRRVMKAVSELLPATYIIATTHSPFILGATDEAQVFRIAKDKQGSLSVKAGFEELYGYPADLVLEKAFVPSLYPLELEKKLSELSELARKVAAGLATSKEKKQHDKLMHELALVNPWLRSLLTLERK